jgi:hypothetical protein
VKVVQLQSHQLINFFKRVVARDLFALLFGAVDCVPLLPFFVAPTTIPALRPLEPIVPEGWTFEMYAPGEGPVFERI